MTPCKEDHCPDPSLKFWNFIENRGREQSISGDLPTTCRRVDSASSWAQDLFRINTSRYAEVTAFSRRVDP